MNNIIGKYKNGNYFVTLYEDGTKIRENDLDFFEPEFAECCDIKITDKCDGNCPFCYEGCTVNGRHADILTPKFLDTIPPYTEIAINGNDLTHPDLIDFLLKMSGRNVIVNMTVNQIHFERKYELIKDLLDNKLIYGLGISLKEPTREFIDKVKTIPSAIIHVINGVVTMPDLDMLAGNNLKILILGYKELKRGVTYLENNNDAVKTLQKDLSNYLFPEIIRNRWFDVVSFDNLALKQLNVKAQMPKYQWDEFYMGDDNAEGSLTSASMYIDMVNGKFAANSCTCEDERFPLMDNITDMFQHLYKRYNK